jgi:hypothetical protein
MWKMIRKLILNNPKPTRISLPWAGRPALAFQRQIGKLSAALTWANSRTAEIWNQSAKDAVCFVLCDHNTKRYLLGPHLKPGMGLQIKFPQEIGKGDMTYYFGKWLITTLTQSHAIMASVSVVFTWWSCLKKQTFVRMQPWFFQYCCCSLVNVNIYSCMNFLTLDSYALSKILQSQLVHLQRYLGTWELKFEFSQVEGISGIYKQKRKTEGKRNTYKITGRITTSKATSALDVSLVHFGILLKSKPLFLYTHLSTPFNFPKPLATLALVSHYTLSNINLFHNSLNQTFRPTTPTRNRAYQECPPVVSLHRTPLHSPIKTPPSIHQ